MNVTDQFASWWYLSGANLFHPMLIATEWMRQYPYPEDLFKTNENGELSILEDETRKDQRWVKEKTLDMLEKGLEKGLDGEAMTTMLACDWRDMVKREGRKHAVSIEFVDKKETQALNWQIVFKRTWEQWRQPVAIADSA